MNNEKMNQIIDEAYDNYRAKSKLSQIPTDLTKEEFVKLCKNDTTFSVYWGLMIEERELSLDERNKWSWDNWGVACEMESVLDEEEVPKRVITITYKEEKFEFYEN